MKERKHLHIAFKKAPERTFASSGSRDTDVSKVGGGDQGGVSEKK